MNHLGADAADAAHPTPKVNEAPQENAAANLAGQVPPPPPAIGQQDGQENADDGNVIEQGGRDEEEAVADEEAPTTEGNHGVVGGPGKDDDDCFKGGDGQGGGAYADSEISMLGGDPLFLVLSEFFMSSGKKGRSVADILEEINENLAKLVKKM